MKRTGLVLLGLLLLSAPVAVQGQSGSGSNFDYSINASNADTITLTNYTGPGGVVVIPANINSLLVTAIGNGAAAVFASNGVSSVTIPNSVFSIAEFACYNCANLTNLTIGNSVTSIGSSAFANCPLAAVAIPASVTSIGDFAFAGGNLAAITVAANNMFYSSANGVLFNKNQTSLIQHPGGLLGNYMIPNSVTNIATVAFANNGLTNVTIPNTVTTIGDSAFFNCSNLASITIPNTVATIGNDAFYDCTSLTNVTLGNGDANIGENAFLDCANLTGVYFQSNAPGAFSYVFSDNTNATVCYLPGTSGWTNTFAGLPASLLNPPDPNGSLQVTLLPDDAATNATWQVDGGISQSSGATVLGLTTGNHTLSFSTVNGWVTPLNQMISVGANSTATAIATYGGGSLQVTINPAGAVMAGGEWEVDGGAPLSSGANATNLSAGTHTVSFTSVSGWVTPPDQTVKITSGVTALANGIYALSNATGAVLTLVKNGSGTIQHGALPTEASIGKKYTVTAVPGAGNIFVNWVGGTSQPYSVLSTSAKYTFTNKPNLLLEANFAPNVFLAAQGNYVGLFAPTSAARAQYNSGSFLFTIAGSGKVSCSLTLGSQKVKFSGTFDVDGRANIVLTNQPFFTIGLQLDFASQTVSGTVSNGAFTAALSGYLSQPVAGYEGRYTFVIPGTTNPAVGPFGISYGTVEVDGLGNITFAGSLADGTAISQSSVISQNGYWPFYVNLYGGQGSLWGWNWFNSQTITASPSLSWINATNSSQSAVYRSGFTNQQVTLTGGLYVSTNTLPLGLPVTLQEETNPPFPITITNLSENTNSLTLNTNITNGLISGSFANPSNANQMIKIHGVILQNQTNAQGYFLGADQSGVFILGPP